MGSSGRVQEIRLRLRARGSVSALDVFLGGGEDRFELKTCRAAWSTPPPGHPTTPVNDGTPTPPVWNPTETSPSQTIPSTSAGRDRRNSVRESARSAYLLRR